MASPARQTKTLVYDHAYHRDEVVVTAEHLRQDEQHHVEYKAAVNQQPGTTQLYMQGQDGPTDVELYVLLY